MKKKCIFVIIRWFDHEDIFMIKKEKKYTYFEAGEGTPIIVLHGLMGGLSNFDGVANYFPSKGYQVIIPELPIYTQSLLKTNLIFIIFI